MGDPKPLSNRSHHHHHPSLFASLTREDSKTENLCPLSHHPPPLHHLMEKSPKTREKAKKRITTHVNKRKPRRKSTKPSTTWRKNGIEEFKNSHNNIMNPMTMMTKPSITSMENLQDFRILIGISDHRQRVMLRFHPMPTILGQTPLFLPRTLDVTMTSSPHYDLISYL